MQRSLTVLRPFSEESNDLCAVSLDVLKVPIQRATIDFLAWKAYRTGIVVDHLSGQPPRQGGLSSGHPLAALPEPTICQYGLVRSIAITLTHSARQHCLASTFQCTTLG
ncbi:hypothetical protein OAS73_00600 [Luminiphilus sp.]|nr:hypothetical protein [Luminiphilus sp.]